MAMSFYGLQLLFHIFLIHYMFFDELIGEENLHTSNTLQFRLP
jgi:hypothetical protein